MSRRSNKTTEKKNGAEKQRQRGVAFLDETRKAGLDIILQSFLEDESANEYEFPSSLAKEERAYVHTTAPKLGLTAKSKGKEPTRFITVTKRSSKTKKESKCSIRLPAKMFTNLSAFLSQFPVTEEELQDVLPSNKQKTNNKLPRIDQTGQLMSQPPQVPVYRCNKALQSHRHSLPIWAHQDHIMKQIQKNQVLLLVGDTGSGKTTQVPQYILDHSAGTKQPVRIICTQPRRIAAISVAERVSQERGENLGSTVGYQIRLESCVSPKTLVTFCTTGVLLRTLMYNQKALQSITHLIIDEIHERDKFCDFLLGVVKSRLVKFPHIRVVLMSAALDVQLFSTYFDDCPVLKVDGKIFPVQQLFLEDILKITNHLGDVSHVYDAAKNLNSAKKKGRKVDFQVSGQLDALLEEAWRTGSQSAFQEIINIVCTLTNVDYRHSVTKMTPLMIASGRGALETVRTLLEHSADPHLEVMVFNQPFNALSFAKHFNAVNVLETLENFVKKMPFMGDVKEMTEEDRALVKIYQQRYDDEVIDTDLIIRILEYIEDSRQDGAVLIFLPGYEDIINLKERIMWSDTLYASRNFAIYTLHSSMQSSDQRRIFQRPPHGKRKIILSTNLAETSVTIDDVVFVIDAGKVKEKSYDGLTGASALRAEWISQASSIQRKGRAGRCRPGYCFHLYSSAKFSTFKKFQKAEILRVPLEELCLQSKLLAPPGTAIVDFLSNVPEAPPSVILRRALQTLTSIDAIDAEENVTDLGRLLLELPVEPRFGKMLLTAAVLRCLDPVLTIVACLSYRDPFLLPASPEDRRIADKRKAELSQGFSSDHIVLLEVYQRWRTAFHQGKQIDFCNHYFVSHPAMEVIHQVRAQVLDQLKKSGFLRNAETLNENAANADAVRAALVAGLYPNVARFSRSGLAETAHEPKAKIHSPAVLSKNALSLHSDWMVYEELTRHKGINPSVHCCTVVSPLTVAIFAGHVRLPADSVVPLRKNPPKESEDSSQDSSDDSLSDSDLLECIENLKITREFLNNHLDDYEDIDTYGSRFQDPAVLKIDPWIRFEMEKNAAEALFQLRQKWQALFIRTVRNKNILNEKHDSEAIQTILRLTHSGHTLENILEKNRFAPKVETGNRFRNTDKFPKKFNEEKNSRFNGSDPRRKIQGPGNLSTREVKQKIEQQKKNLRERFTDPSLFPPSIAAAIYGAEGTTEKQEC